MSRTNCISAALVLALLGASGCQPHYSHATTAVVLNVEWETASQLRQAQLHPQHYLEVTAVLKSGDEITSKLPINLDQSRQLRDGAKLLVRSSDGKFLEGLVTIVPR